MLPVQLQYIGRIFASKTQRFMDLYPLLLKRAGLPEGTKLSIYEEIKFDPTVMVDLQNPSHSLANAQLEDGDILCLQEQPSEVSTLLLMCLLLPSFSARKPDLCCLPCHGPFRDEPLQPYSVERSKHDGSA
jgi:hypothetical protein